MAWVTVNYHASRTGLTEKAIRARIERGEWLEGAVWRKTGGRIFISEEGFQLWVEDRGSELLAIACKSTSNGRASGAGRG